MFLVHLIKEESKITLLLVFNFSKNSPPNLMREMMELGTETQLFA